MSALDSSTSHTTFDGSARVGGDWCRTRCEEFRDGFRLTVADAPTVTVFRHGRVAAPVGDSAPTPLESAVREGPARLLGLALQSTFCLHASAVSIEDAVVAFAGSSGEGKSTLAALLDAAGSPRLADDIVPVRVGERAATASWVDTGDRIARTDATSTALRAVCLLGTAETVTARRIHGAAAASALVRHTVAARLFGADLLARHLEWSARLAELVVIVELKYPRRLDIAPQIAQALACV